MQLEVIRATSPWQQAGAHYEVLLRPHGKLSGGGRKNS